MYSSIQSYLREVSRQQLCVYLNQNHFLSRDFDKWNFSEKDTRCASVALTGYSGTMILEAHFRHRDVVKLFSGKMELAKQKLSKATACDFAAEYTNYVAGAVKRVLSPNHIEFDSCVPTLEHTTRAEIARISKRPGNHQGLWMLTDGKIEIVCVAHLTITKLVPFRTIIPNLAMSLFEKASIGEVEFLT